MWIGRAECNFGWCRNHPKDFQLMVEGPRRKHAFQLQFLLHRMIMQGYQCAAGDCNNLVLNKPDELVPGLKLVGEIKPPPSKDIQVRIAIPASISS